MLPFLTIIMQNESNTTLKKTSLKDMLTKISYMFHKKMKLPQVMQWQLIWTWEFPYLNTYDKNKERQQQELLGQSAVSNPSWVDFLLKRWCVFVLDDNLNKLVTCAGSLEVLCTKVLPSSNKHVDFMEMVLTVQFFSCWRHMAAIQWHFRVENTRWVLFHLTGTSFSFDLMTFMGWDNQSSQTIK